MRISCMFFSLLLLLASAMEFGPELAKNGANAVRIPEHTCHKVIETNSCELHKCMEECSKEPAGLGGCRDNICYCTYYCKDPPICLRMFDLICEILRIRVYVSGYY
ncbi:hypothetical protein GQ457_01G014390 [Hibiscus cannabinus]